jgi:hypothetical protein
VAALIDHQSDMKVAGKVGTVGDCATVGVELSPDDVRPKAKMIFLTREDSDAARFAAVQSGGSAFIHTSGQHGRM